MSLPEIIQYTDRLEKEAKALIKDILRITWHMRGAVDLNEAYMLDSEQIDVMNDIIRENFEFTKETKIPFI
jgi:hypothetical protein